MNIGRASAVRTTTVCALNTLTPGVRVTLAVVLDDANVPASGPLETVVGPPVADTAVMFSDVPTGKLLALTATVTGLAVVGGRTMSGDAWNEPIGFAGADTPPTEVITSDGGLTGIAELGSAAETRTP